MHYYSLVNSDCLEHLKSLDENSFDSLVTDPPAGINFMGKNWDSNKGGRTQWIAWMTEVSKEMLRVLKPGAHGLVWAIPRTSHWTAFALEKAGFEVRDIIHHVFGSGFPKSLDISKAIDKARGHQGDYGAPKSDAHAGWISRGRMRGDDGHEGFQRPWMNDQLAVDKNARHYLPATPEAKQWQGWGTALKPAAEHWILVRKPLDEKTVAKNVLKHGTGGLNIDGSRISSEPWKAHSATGLAKTKFFSEGDTPVIYKEPHTQGRFPANLTLSHHPECEEDCHEDCPVKQLDEQVSQTMKMHRAGNKSHGNPKKIGDKSIFGIGTDDGPSVTYDRENSAKASRFFYCAKASKRDKGIDNKHPTVKNTKLMEYLIKLVTPPEGIVLDPFMGSGSTGVAAVRLGFRFYGIEQDQEYFQIAARRIPFKE